MINMPASCIYTFDRFGVDRQNRVLYRDGRSVALPPKAFDLLVYLLEHSNQIVIKQDMINAVWQGAAIETGSIARNIALLRAALEDTAANGYILTVAKRGYKFCANVTKLSPANAAIAKSRMTTCLSHGTKDSGSSFSLSLYWLRRLMAGDYPILIGLLAVALATAFVIPTQFNWSEYKRKQLTSNSSELPIIAVAISPDGKLLAYTESNQVYVSPMGSTERKALMTPIGAMPANLNWFPDSHHLLISGFNPKQHRAVTWSTSTSADEVQLIDTSATTPRLSSDGKHIAYTHNNSQLWIANADGTDPKQLAITAARSKFVLLPQFSTDGEFIITARRNVDTMHTMIEARHIASGATVLLYETDQYIADFLLLSSDDLFISQTIKLNTNTISTEIISTEVDLQRGTHGTLHQIGNWSSGVINHFSATQDGRHVAVINDQTQSDVYIADLQNNGSVIANMRRLTMDDSSDRPAGWWNDSQSVLFCSNRHDSFGVYRQSDDQANADTLVSDSNDSKLPVLTPDGHWLLYFSSAPVDELTNSQVSLMRKPTAGGPADLIDAKPDLHRSIRCAHTVNSCVVAEHTTTEAIFYQFDADKGRSRELARVPWVAGNSLYDWDVSPDAKYIAYIDNTDTANNIAIISLATNNTTTHLTVPGFEQLSTLSWDATGTGFYISSHESDTDTTPLVMLYVSLSGHVNTLRYQLNSNESWAFPSPDGHHLAYQQWSNNGNVWLLER